MIEAIHRTGLVFFPAFDWAISPTHPEREERLLYTQDQIFEEGLFDIEGIDEFKPSIACEQDIQRVHFCVPDIRQVTTLSHFISAGGAITIAEAIAQKKIDHGFALVRPPGHHAMRVVHGSRGFCNINIEAVMIEHLRTAHGVKKIAVIDTDCHHGDGTQDIFWHDPDTLFISLHQDGRTLFPGTGFINELGGPNALGTTLNIPLPPYTSEEGFLYVVENAVLPVLAEFQPELVVNSAGQDNHYTDPITNMNFSAQGYARLTEILKPDIAVLEGGYAIEGALPYINLGIILAMAGLDFSHVKEPDYNPERIRQSGKVTDYITKLSQKVLDLWESRHRLKDVYHKDKEFVDRSRNIFYDTANLYEKQNERIRICADCNGALRIDSSSDKGQHLLGIHIPPKACSRCKSVAYKWYETAEKDDFTLVALQDRTEDVYTVKKGQVTGNK